MMGRTVPLVVDILVASFAGVRLHKKFAGNFLAAVDLCGTWEKGAGWTVAFLVHRQRRQCGVFNASVQVPASFANIAGRGRKHCDDRDRYANANKSISGEP